MRETKELHYDGPVDDALILHLTDRECQVLESFWAGLRYSEVSSLMDIEISTVCMHLASAKLKLGTRTVISTVAYYAEHEKEIKHRGYKFREEAQREIGHL